MCERWLPVVEFEGCYEVSSHARVRSLARLVRCRNGWRSVPPRILKQYITNAPGGGRYLYVRLSKENCVHHCNVHVLMLSAFRGPRPKGMHACHGDDDKMNNSLDNLRWDTQSGNEIDKVRNGRHPWAKRIECVNGHAWSEENTRIYKGKRKCRSCERDQNRKRRPARKVLAQLESGAA